MAMTSEPKAPERMWVRITDLTVMFNMPSDMDKQDIEYIRADAAQAMVAVKPLEWVDDSVPNRKRAFTTTDFGGYSVHQSNLDNVGFWVHSPTGNLGGAPDFDAAKATAQDDYEQRILSALQSPDDASAALAERERLAYERGKCDALRDMTRPGDTLHDC